MLSCESCDYIKELQKDSKGRALHVCEFTGFVFKKEIQDYELEQHPCFNQDYHAYELAQKKLGESNRTA